MLDGETNRYYPLPPSDHVPHELIKAQLFQGFRGVLFVNHDVPAIVEVNAQDVLG